MVALKATSSLDATDQTDVALDLIARAGDADFVDLRISGYFDSGSDKCTVTEVAVPASLPTS